MAEPNPPPSPEKTRVTADQAAAPASNGGDTVSPEEARKGAQKREPNPGRAAADEALKGKDYGKWAEPKLKKKKKADPMIGRTIADRYEVLSLLGKGGMGAVYKARQPAVQRMIALKVLLKEFTENETVIKRFHQEALAASRLTHPNTISVYDFGQTPDHVLYIAMEYLRGESLAQALARGGHMPPKRVIHIMRQVCKSLAEAHKAGIIHRDLKPDNIYLTEIQGERDFVKVLDFGVAKLKEYEGKEGTLTQAGMIFGTPKYMSPEQARSGDLDSRSDVYALGVILFEMLMGKPPFTGDNPLSILIAHVNEQPAAFAHFNPRVDVPKPLEAVVFKALNKDRDKRHQSVEELQSELDAVEELLEGASYDSVADRLPGGAVPGADGSPSLAGPAIVAPASDGTAPSPGVVSLERGGTLLIDDDGNVIPRDESAGSLGLDGDGGTRALEAYDRERRGGGLGLWVMLGLAVPVIGVGAWLFSSGDNPVVPPPSTKPIATAPTKIPDAGVALAPDAKVIAEAKVADAAVVAEAKAADAAVKPKTPRKPIKARTREFVIKVDPPGTVVLNAANGAQVAVAKPLARLKLKKTTSYLLQKPGYRDKAITLNFNGERSHSYRLKPKATARPITRPNKPKTPTGSGTPTPRGVDSVEVGREGRRDLDLR